MPHDYFVWVQDIRVVQKGAIRINNREYVNNMLVPFNGEQVIVEYALNNDAFVKIFNADGSKFIIQAELVKRKSGLSLSLLEDREDRQKQAKIKRLNKHIQEAEQQYIPVINAQEQAALPVVNGIELDLAILDAKQPELIDIDIRQLSTG